VLYLFGAKSRKRWANEGVERVAKLLEEVRVNGTKLEF